MKPVTTSSRIVELRHLRGRDEEPYAPVEERPAWPRHSWLIIVLYGVVVTACCARAWKEANEMKDAPVAAEMEAGQ